MEAIVCDTSSLTRLFKGEALPVIGFVFQKVHIPHEVWEECRPDVRAAMIELNFERMSPVPDLIAKFGRGERAMLNVALAHGISQILTDDDKAINEANRLALEPFGSLDVLVIAKRFGADITVRGVVEKMRRKNERIEESEFQRALHNVGEL